MTETRLSQLNIKSLAPKNGYHPSPVAWEDQILYFLLLDRFSDNQEKGYKDIHGKTVIHGNTPLFTETDKQNAVKNNADAAKWRDAGGKYVGGSISGLHSKLGYLKRLGITTIWISPLFKQVAFQETYHGYGIQDFLKINPKFGTKQQLKDLVAAAHAQGILVILDIILNHTGNIFSYDSNRQPHYQDENKHFDPRWDGGHYPVLGFNDKDGRPSIPFTRAGVPSPGNFEDLDGTVWPVEFQDPSYFTQKGRISNFDFDPEFREGDFFDLKDIHHGQGSAEDYNASAALQSLCEVYKYWIAFADIDGYRIDTVKHMDNGATRIFVSAMHEFAQSIGKDNFFLVGEITGGRTRAFETLEVTGLDAALGIDDIPDKLEFLAKGYRNPADYFNLFRNSLLIGKDSHTWFRNKVVTLFNDHDQVSRGTYKARFCADVDSAKQVLNALALNIFTLGIPCIYYGTEQSFNGQGGGIGADRYIREAMFGGEFGSFESKQVHFFNEAHPVYDSLSKLIAIRRSRQALRRGRQYLRSISGDGLHFGLPQIMGERLLSIVAWSRILSDSEIVVAINTDPYEPKTAWVTVDTALHKAGDTLTCIYSSDSKQIGNQVVIEAKDGLAISMTIEAAGLVIFE